MNQFVTRMVTGLSILAASQGALAEQASSSSKQDTTLEERVEKLEGRVAFLEQFLQNSPSNQPCFKKANGMAPAWAEIVTRDSGGWKLSNRAFRNSSEFELLKRIPLQNNQEVLVVRLSFKKSDGTCEVAAYFGSSVVEY